MATVAIGAVGLLGCSSTGSKAQSGSLGPAKSPPVTAASSNSTSSTVDPNACGYHEGRTTTQQVRGLQVVVHLPLCYDTTHDRYPVIMLIHGSGNDETQWQEVGAITDADELASSGQIGPAILIIPGLKPEGVADEGRAAIDLVPWVDETYRTIPDAAHRAIGGISLGGGAALFAAATRPDLFGVVGGHSPATGSTFDQVLEGLPSNSGRIWLDIGESDSLAESTTSLASSLKKEGVKVELEVNPGRHDDEYWRAHTADYLRFYDSRLR